MTEPSESSKQPEQWAIVELMGHRQLAGRVSEVQRYGVTMLRLEIPQEDGTFVTQFFSTRVLYSELPSTEEAVREMFRKPPKLDPIDDDEDIPW